MDKLVHNFVQILWTSHKKGCDQFVDNMNNSTDGHELSNHFFGFKAVLPTRAQTTFQKISTL